MLATYVPWSHPMSQAIASAANVLRDHPGGPVALPIHRASGADLKHSSTVGDHHQHTNLRLALVGVRKRRVIERNDHGVGQIDQGQHYAFIGSVLKVGHRVVSLH